MKDILISIGKKTKLYYAYMYIWKKTVGRYLDRTNYEWEKRYSPKLLKRKAMELIEGKAILEGGGDITNCFSWL